MPPGTPTVYVVDDDDAVRDSLLFLLDVSGLPAQGFAGVAAFLAALPKGAAGCIVTDLRMPGLDGTDLLGLLPARGIFLPVIVMTGHANAEGAARALAAGAFHFIEKPFNDVALFDAVRAALAVGQPDRVPSYAQRSGCSL
jgi:two-component system response regulator FixJ